MQRTLFFFLSAILAFAVFPSNTSAQNTTGSNVAGTLKLPVKVTSAEKINPNSVQVFFSDSTIMTLDFYGENIVRIFEDPNGGIIRDPEAKPPASILVEQPRRTVSALKLQDESNALTISTVKMTIKFNKSNSTFKIINNENNSTVAQTLAPPLFNEKEATLKLVEDTEEYFFGGGVQNGRFSHKGKKISIENQNSWTDGGVASPTPFYWSTNGYGFMWYTFSKGVYDFGAKEKGTVSLSHKTPYLDVFFMVNSGAVPILNDFYQLTGNPVLIPKFGFYEGHLNAYNRDYWKEDEKGILFEDGKRYKESQKDKSGIKESLNGEKNNYQFSARAVIDRYNANDMPLGWILPNDGYGAGYGQTETLEGNVANLKSFGDYAREHGVQIGLWTQSDLHPKDSISALLQRDIVREVRDAGVRVLKTDVAWVGPGYSFGLNGVSDVGHIMPYYGKDARPFIISLDGWAGTQRYAGIWSGDQTGGVWEYIRFHIPTYLGSGLSGQPNITSDMDGIFGGNNMQVNIRDFQWKTFSPMQLNMDGWGSNPKYPQALGEPATSINRNYLKWKSELMPYAYSIAREAVDGLPMIRAMFLEYPNKYTLGTATKYQYLYGSNFLVAPIYQETQADKEGNDIRNGIYLPEGSWIDYFSGEKYEGDRIINNFDAPLWKLPVFVKNGAIIPMTNPNNNVTEIDKKLRIYEIYPFKTSSFTEYDDDGKTEAYRYGEGVSTLIESRVNGSNATIIVHPAEGDFEGFEKNKATEFRINVTEKPKRVTIRNGRKKIKLQEVKSLEEFGKGSNIYYYDAAPNFNRFATEGSKLEKMKITKNPQLLVKTAPTDITYAPLTLIIKGFHFKPEDRLLKSTGALQVPVNAAITEENTKPYSVIPTWTKQSNADYYEIQFNDQLYSTIKDSFLLFDELKPETDYRFQLRAVNKDGVSPWTSFGVKTKSNPLEFAIKGITAQVSVPSQGGSEIEKLFDFDEGNTWHTKWSEKAVPFEMLIDLQSVNELDKMEYLPRDKGNGILLQGKIFYGNSKTNLEKAGAFDWANDGSTKLFEFKNKPTARYVKISVSKAVGDFGSGRELYIFKVPGSESYLPGDINNDRLIDMNDITSYGNYMGLRKGDADFEGYISNGDVNKNGLIDAFDLSNVATRIRGGAKADSSEIRGTLDISTNSDRYKKGDVVELKVKGVDLKAVNAMSFALPYSEQDFEFAGIETVNMKQMENFTNDRLHSNGKKALYPTFVNIGDKPVLQGSEELFIIRFRAKRDGRVNLRPIDVMLVDKELNVIEL